MGLTVLANQTSLVCSQVPSSCGQTSASTSLKHPDHMAVHNARDAISHEIKGRKTWGFTPEIEMRCAIPFRILLDCRCFPLKSYPYSSMIGPLRLNIIAIPCCGWSHPQQGMAMIFSLITTQQGIYALKYL